jgi:hypothetical protein
MIPLQFRQNTLLSGIIWGFFIPLVGVAVLMMIDETIVDADILLPNNNVYLGQKPRTLYLIGICLNLIPFQLYTNRKMDTALRGIGISTMIYAAAWFAYFASDIM